ncbi:TadE/TadG family type IV pilus assembly protein [Adlercreutzia sp. R21]|uniref:TadE/TadG family type IV pilus assembly protein n=1 Tax=Adlercreutzia wanghongyangiae TaxID=3111451 RepID=UPI002DBA03E4|nr:TadE/TadG family type IV pilus assembly protein [Adlercreutzia sp. R21]MEC4184667.1 TadE/TadG family type IV pilus assembly protein [Adlercreutzia sp. R21]
MGWVRRIRGDAGQTTVEAAFALPVLFLLVLLLVQPGIILYDRMVMQAAAAEGCRLLATGDGGEEACVAFVERRLGAVPQQDNFHVHSTGCTWEVRCEGGAAADRSQVTVRTEVRPLPLLDVGATLLGLVNERGNIEVEVQVSVPTRAMWAQESLGGVRPGEKVGEWCEGD